jgi:hypothetical protein
LWMVSNTVCISGQVLPNTACSRCFARVSQNEPSLSERQAEIEPPRSPRSLRKTNANQETFTKKLCALLFLAVNCSSLCSLRLCGENCPSTTAHKTSLRSGRGNAGSQIASHRTPRNDGVTTLPVTQTVGLKA